MSGASRPRWEEERSQQVAYCIPPETAGEYHRRPFSFACHIKSLARAPTYARAHTHACHREGGEENMRKMSSERGTKEEIKGGG